LTLTAICFFYFCSMIKQSHLKSFADIAAVVAEDRKENEKQEQTGTKLVQIIKPNVDQEAAWIKKAGKLHSGYKQLNPKQLHRVFVLPFR